MQLAKTFNEEFFLRLNQLRRFTNHGPSIGRFVEVLLLDLLNKYFPKSLSFSSGFIQAMDPELSKSISSQIDILCYDRLNFPVAFESNEIIVATPASIKGLIEVKSTLTKSSIQQVIDLTSLDVMKETHIESKTYLIGTKSKIKSHSAFEFLKTHYQNRENKLVRLIGGIYSFDWNNRIHCDLRVIDGKLKYTILLLKGNDYGLAPFVLNLIYELYGAKAYESIANITAPSLNKVVDSAEIELFTS